MGMNGVGGGVGVAVGGTGVGVGVGGTGVGVGCGGTGVGVGVAAGDGAITGVVVPPGTGDEPVAAVGGLDVPVAPGDAGAAGEGVAVPGVAATVPVGVRVAGGEPIVMTVPPPGEGVSPAVTAGGLSPPLKSAAAPPAARTRTSAPPARATSQRARDGGFSPVPPAASTPGTGA